MSFIEVYFPDLDDEISEVLIAELSMLDYESFWQDENSLRAYIDEANFKKLALDEIVLKYTNEKVLQYSFQATKPGEWTRVKEVFEPFVVADKITIKSDSDSLHADTEYQLLMDAQMAFGTGKHPSSANCLKLMLGVDFQNKTVLDIGTGSGILAVMAEKLGAASIRAVDNNPWAIDVANQVVSDNMCMKVELAVNDIEGELHCKKKYDILLANLNMDVLTTELIKLPAFLNEEGIFLIGGFMEKDADKIVQILDQLHVKLVEKHISESWCAMILETKRKSKK